MGLALFVCAADSAAGDVRLSFRGCMAAAGVSALGCSSGGPIARVTGLSFSPDGSLLAVAGTRSSGVSLFARDASTGALTAIGCTSDDATDGRDGTDGACADGDALEGPTAVVGDGARFYVGATRTGAVDTLTVGQGLVPGQCIKASGRDSRCAEEPALAGARSLALAPGGGQLYVAAAAADAVVTLRREPGGGSLTPAGCISASGLDGHCRNGAALRAPTGIVASADGRAVYVLASGSEGVASFARDPVTGNLRQTGCVMARVPRGGTCAHQRSLTGAYALALSPDGRHVYVAGRYSDALTLLKADPVRATLSFAGCRGRPTRRASCTPDGALDGVRSVAVSPDGRTVAAATDTSLELFARDPATGALRRVACVRARPRRGTQCTVVRSIMGARSLALSPDSRDLYVGTETGVAGFRMEASG